MATTKKPTINNDAVCGKAGHSDYCVQVSAFRQRCLLCNYIGKYTDPTWSTLPIAEDESVLIGDVPEGTITGRTRDLTLAPWNFNNMTQPEPPTR